MNDSFVSFNQKLPPVHGDKMKLLGTELNQILYRINEEVLKNAGAIVHDNALDVSEELAEIGQELLRLSFDMHARPGEQNLRSRLSKNIDQSIIKLIAMKIIIEKKLV